MDRKYIDDHHIAARYLADQLSDADREAFETYYVEHPDVLRDLEAAARMKVGLAQLREAGELDALMIARTWRPNRRFLAAAAVAAAPKPRKDRRLTFFLDRGSRTCSIIANVPPPRAFSRLER